MQGVMWLVFLCYLAYLTTLLLAPNPLWLVETRDEPPELLRTVDAGHAPVELVRVDGCLP